MGGLFFLCYLLTEVVICACYSGRPHNDTPGRTSIFGIFVRATYLFLVRGKHPKSWGAESEPVV